MHAALQLVCTSMQLVCTVHTKASHSRSVYEQKLHIFVEICIDFKQGNHIFLYLPCVLDFTFVSCVLIVWFSPNFGDGFKMHKSKSMKRHKRIWRACWGNPDWDRSSFRHAKNTASAQMIVSETLFCQKLGNFLRISKIQIALYFLHLPIIQCSAKVNTITSFIQIKD